MKLLVGLVAASVTGSSLSNVLGTGQANTDKKEEVVRLAKLAPNLTAIDLENMKHIPKYKTALDLEIEESIAKMTQAVASVDGTLASINAKHEEKYHKKYAEFVEEKTKKLNELVDKLNEKSSNRTLKDIKIGELQSIIKKL
jgi:hypothetical protein